MIVTLRTERMGTLAQIRAFLDGKEPADFELTHRGFAQALARRTRVRFEHHEPQQTGEGTGEAILGKVTGFSRAQMKFSHRPTTPDREDS